MYQLIRPILMIIAVIILPWITELYTTINISDLSISDISILFTAVAWLINRLLLLRCTVPIQKLDSPGCESNKQWYQCREWQNSKCTWILCGYIFSKKLYYVQEFFSFSLWCKCTHDFAQLFYSYSRRRLMWSLLMLSFAIFVKRNIHQNNLSKQVKKILAKNKNTFQIFKH